MNNSIQMVVFRAEEGNYAVNIDRLKGLSAIVRLLPYPKHPTMC